MLRCLRRRAGGAAEVGTCCGIVEVVEGRRHHEGRVRTQEGKVRAPGLALRLLAEPVEEGTGEEGSFGLVLAVARRRPVRQRRLASLRPVHPAPVLRLLVAALPPPGEPRGVVLRQLPRYPEARQRPARKRTRLNSST